MEGFDPTGGVRPRTDLPRAVARTPLLRNAGPQQRSSVRQGGRSLWLKVPAKVWR